MYLLREVLSSPHACTLPMTWESEVDRYVKRLRGDLRTEGYIRNATNYLNALGNDLKPEHFLDLEGDQLTEWFLKVRDHGISGRGPIADASLNSIKAVVKACLRMLNDKVTPKSFRDITVGKNRSRVRAKADLPTDEEVSELAKALSVKNRAVCLAIRYSGGRPSEVLSLKKGDAVPVGSGFDLTFRETKTGDPRTVPLEGREANSALEAWFAQAPEGEYLFPSYKGGPLGYQSIGKAMKRAAKRLGVKVILPYTLRHARVTDLKNAPSGLRNRLMGWKSDAMARNYEHLDTGDLRAFVEEREGEPVTDQEELQRLADQFFALAGKLGLVLEPRVEVVVATKKDKKGRVTAWKYEENSRQAEEPLTPPYSSLARSSLAVCGREETKMNGRVRLSKMSLGVIGAVVLAVLVVSAAVIMSAQVEREQSVFTALDLTVTPEVFPDLVAGEGITTTQAVDILVMNPLDNPIVSGIIVTITLVAVDGCASGTVLENTFSASDLCLEPLTSSAFSLNPGESRPMSLLFEYSLTFRGSAAYTFYAEGTN